MKCFNHPGNEALSICTVCGRALCPECINEIDDAIVCKNRCEENKLNQDKARLSCYTILNRFASVYGITALIYLLTGMILLIAGFTIQTLLGIFIIIPLGITFIISALLQYSAAKKFIEK